MRRHITLDLIKHGLVIAKLTMPPGNPSRRTATDAEKEAGREMRDADRVKRDEERAKEEEERARKREEEKKEETAKSTKEATDLEARTAEEIKRMASLEEEPSLTLVPPVSERAFPSFPTDDGMWGEASQTFIVSGISTQTAIPAATQTESGQKYKEVFGDRAFRTQHSRVVGPSIAIRPPKHNRPQSRLRRPPGSRRSRSRYHRRSHHRRPDERRKSRSARRRSAHRSHRRSHRSACGRRYSLGRNGPNKRDHKESPSYREEGKRVKRPGINLARMLRKDLIGKHAFQPFSSTDFLRTAEIFGHYGYFPLAAIRDMDARERDMFCSMSSVTTTDVTVFRT